MAAFATAQAMLSRVTPLTWALAVAGIWFMPLRALVVVTGVSVAGTTARAARASGDHDLAMLVHAVAELSRDEEHRPVLHRVK